MGPVREGSTLKLLDGPGVSDDRFLLEVADKSVADTWRHKVGKEKSVEEDSLGSENHKAHEHAGFREFQEGKEVHAFVVRFFQEGFNPIHPRVNKLAN